MAKLYLATLSPDESISATDAAAEFARIVRSADRSLSPSDVVSLPLVDGGAGTLEFLVGHSLGSYVEVEATDADGDQAIVPFGLCGSDEKLAVIEMQTIAAVTSPGQRGTTYGVGELIRDVLDEGAFSVVLCAEEPIARDAGLGLAAALGVRFLDEHGTEIAMNQPEVDLLQIASIDVTGRSFELLAARYFVARSARSVPLDPADTAFLAELRHLAAIVKRDVGIEIPIDTLSLSVSGVEFGLIAFLSAALRNGGELVLEAAEIEKTMGETSGEALLLFARDEAQLTFAPAVDRLLAAASSKRLPIVFVFSNPVGTETSKVLEKKYKGAVIRSLQDVSVFQAPLTAASKPDEIRRNMLLRLEKLVPDLLPKPARKRAIA